MTTIDQFSGIPDARELSMLANELFPDLTEGVYGIHGADLPASSVPEATLPDTSVKEATPPAS